jgi:hypothetical protein
MQPLFVNSSTSATIAVLLHMILDMILYFFGTASVVHPHDKIAAFNLCICKVCTRIVMVSKYFKLIRSCTACYFVLVRVDDIFEPVILLISSNTLNLGVRSLL